MPGPEGTSDPLASAWRLSDAGDHAAALEAADRAIALESDRAEARTARGWALENLDRPAEAREAYLEALRLHPGDLRAKEGLSNVLRRFGLPEADALAVEVVADASSREADVETLELQGWCEFRLGRLDAAEATLRRGLDHDPEALSVRLDLALVLLCAGRGREALEAYEAGLVAARRTSDKAGVVAVALADLDETLDERPDLRHEPSTVAARAILAGFGAGPSSGSAGLSMGDA